MMIAKKAIPRRTMLRGIGATLALPLLDGMVPALTALSKTAAKPIARFGTVYVPNGIIMAGWTPATEGAGFEFTPTLKPLEAHRKQLLVLSGLDNTGASSRTGGSGAHAKPAGAFMTGIEPLRTTSSASLQLGTSLDQILAQQIGQETPLPSLELGLEGTDTVNGVGTCDVRLQLRLPEPPGLEQPDDAAAGGGEPARGLRAPLRQRREHRSGGAQGPPAPAGQHHRLGARQGARP